MAQTPEEQIQQAVDSMAADLVEVVEAIENSIPTTKGHYGEYLAILSQANDPTKAVLLAEALTKAGANDFGITSAMRILCPDRVAYPETDTTN